MIVYLPDLDTLDTFLTWIPWYLDIGHNSPKGDATVNLTYYVISVLQCDFMGMTLNIPAGSCFEPFLLGLVFYQARICFPVMSDSVSDIVSCF